MSKNLFLDILVIFYNAKKNYLNLIFYQTLFNTINNLAISSKYLFKF